jgi:hypothetical protein
MNFVWLITTLYFAPFALWTYFTFGRQKQAAAGNAWSFPVIIATVFAGRSGPLACSSKSAIKSLWQAKTCLDASQKSAYPASTCELGSDSDAYGRLSSLGLNQGYRTGRR